MIDGAEETDLLEPLVGDLCARNNMLSLMDQSIGYSPGQFFLFGWMKSTRLHDDA